VAFSALFAVLAMPAAQRLSIFFASSLGVG